MPHLSRKEVGQKTQSALEEHLLAFLLETGVRNRKKIFQELLTKTEQQMLAKRLFLVVLLSKELSIYEISNTLEVSPSTVARFKAKLERGHYRTTTQWLKGRIENKVLRFIATFAAIPFKAKRRSISQILED